jgi:NADH dehydrogenase
LPLALADLIGYLGDLVAWFGIKPTLTRDQARQLRRDNVASGEGFDALGIRPTAMDVVLPAYLDRFRKAGRFRPSQV